jgi:AcrR family transcriptional regulator
MTSDTRTATRPGRRPRNRRGEGHRLRAELVAAAGSQLAETGAPEAVSLRRVAEIAGVSAPAIYRHFPNKEALLFAVVEDRFGQFRNVLLNAAAQGGDDPFAALKGASLAYLAWGIDRPAYYRVLFGPIGGAILAAGGAAAETREEFYEGGPAAEAFLMAVHLIERCLAAGPGGRALDAFAVATELWAFLHGLVDLKTHHAGFPWPQLDSLVDGWAERLRTVVAAD